jgi:hypothetical protein
MIPEPTLQVPQNQKRWFRKKLSRSERDKARQTVICVSASGQ